jgi:hypothetical protein
MRNKLTAVIISGVFFLASVSLVQAKLGDFSDTSRIQINPVVTATASPTPKPLILPSNAPKLIQKINLIKEEFKNHRGHLSYVTVTAKGTNDITVLDGDKTIKVNFDSNTHFRRRFWGKSLPSEISVNDKLDIVGRWANEGKTEINAVLIRNLSIQKRFGTFFGTVKTITDTGFVMTTIHKGEETVTIDTSTKLVNRKETSITVSDIKVGDRVRVKGLWDLTNFTISEVTQIKDFSLPPFESPTPKATPSATP